MQEKITFDLAPRVRIQTQDFDVQTEIDEVLGAKNGSKTGAVCVFVGTVRDASAEKSDVSAMELEHYEGMTQKSIEAIIDKAFEKFDLFDVKVIHRVGKLYLKDKIVLVIATSKHRRESFNGCEFVMDYLKTQAPFWKKEYTNDGAKWVDARESDDAALARWGIKSNNAK